ncbi:MAG: hypothetical protein R3F43_05570 [bacterium]
MTCFVGADGTLGAAPDEDCADCNGWHHGTALVDQYFQCVEGYKALILDIVEAELGPEALNADKTLKLRGSSGELYQLGNDNFNVTLAYGFWLVSRRVRGLLDDETENHCQLKPEGYGHFDVERPPSSSPVPHPRVRPRPPGRRRAGDDLPLPASVTPNRLEVQILDEDLFDPIDTVVDHQFNVVQDEWSEGGTLVSVQATFTIVFVPVTIKGGIAGEIGVAYGIDGEVPLEPQTGDCDLIRFTRKLQSFRAGRQVRLRHHRRRHRRGGHPIDLTIIRIDLPFDVTVAIGLNDDLDLILDIETNLPISWCRCSRARSRSTSGFSGRVQGVIFAWDGLRFGGEPAQRPARGAAAAPARRGHRPLQHVAEPAGSTSGISAAGPRPNPSTPQESSCTLIVPALVVATLAAVPPWAAAAPPGRPPPTPACASPPVRRCATGWSTPATTASPRRRWARPPRSSPTPIWPSK